jgi:hypothetical protein
MTSTDTSDPERVLTPIEGCKGQRVSFGALNQDFFEVHTEQACPWPRMFCMVQRWIWFLPQFPWDAKAGTPPSLH